MSEQRIIEGDCLDILKTLPDNSVDSVVTDPPYGLSFMGKKWDYDVPSEDVWRECLRVLKPGGHLLSFAGTRTQHRMAVRIEDAGFEIRDMIAWVYGSGFPKSLNIGKAVDKLQGNEREVERHHIQSQTNPNSKPGSVLNEETSGIRNSWTVTKGTSPYEGWGTALKPALEPITVARKPLIGTVAENVLTYGTGGLNIDACRVGTEKVGWNGLGDTPRNAYMEGWNPDGVQRENTGRFPANLIHDGSEEVVGLFPNDSARFFYCAKASKKDRDEGLDGFASKPLAFSNQAKAELKRGNTDFDGGDAKGHGNAIRHLKNNHPTVKPTDLMRYLCRLVTPPGGTVLDPFMGSGSTGKAAKLEGFNFIGIERDPEYVKIANARILSVDTPMF